MFEEVGKAPKELVARKWALAMDSLYALVGIAACAVQYWKHGTVHPAYLAIYLLIGVLGAYWLVRDMMSSFVWKRSTIFRNTVFVLIAVFGRVVVDAVYEFRGIR